MECNFFILKNTKKIPCTIIHVERSLLCRGLEPWELNIFEFPLVERCKSSGKIFYQHCSFKFKNLVTPLY